MNQISPTLTQETEQQIDRRLWPGEPPAFGPRHLDELMIWAYREGASDIRLQTNSPVFIQIHGRMRQVTSRGLTQSEIVKSFGRFLAYESLRRSNPRAGGSRYGDLGSWRCRSGRARRHDHAPDPSFNASLRDEFTAYEPSAASIEAVQRAFGSVARKRCR